MNPILAAAVIEFVGLCMFKQGTTTPVEVILPRVGSDVQQLVPHELDAHPVALRSDIQLVRDAQFDRRRYPVTLPVNPQQLGTPMMAMSVESHTAIIAFRDDAFLTSDWQKQPLKPLAELNYSYVELNGEQIRVVATGSNPEKTEIPSKLELPSVKAGCGDRALSADYGAPPFAKAAAVVQIAAGTLTACKPKIGDSVPGRVDTRLAFAQEGPIIIETVKTPKKKRLELKPEHIVIIGNVPTAWLNSTPQTSATALRTSDAMHFEVFGSMLAGTGPCVQPKSEATECDINSEQPAFGPRERRGSGRPTFGTTYNVWREGVSDSRPPRPDGCPNCFVSYACSNSQYP